MKNKLDVVITLIALVAGDIALYYTGKTAYESGFQVYPTAIFLSVLAVGLVLVADSYKFLKKELS